ncbi:mannose-6-phosphate isomerase [Sinorhizobium medicae]|uniref:AGE family epimerase/isomerase n=2 Tax=Sinorhizobium medicae TaxID=110321 RepID=A0A508X1P9_9HYPH|nr:mannose-6-phosphate isomerase Pmi [Sinorhizobium medicae]ABR61701.1 Mannose-6-phosphate isomerase [Sinorhizobium medicae WSM419]MBO1941418.1 mannose-6-phosphate isomerase Pmi [Sinorhizobium medicae]MBO1959315.1 mannose-6-phosphate isomerase Pmi [Sinorhizobium medicae]MDX0408682.1 mannose-6-phosphate isomerase [Sinorhizobium medicae]MDX0414604.1 mannose-6-phosphate isomerase [Sinorhizobium medicae]
MDIHLQAGALSGWLTEAALPLWRQKGFDGGFVETIHMNGEPTRADRRSRVQPRQVYCFAAAGRRGWTGDWRMAAEDGLRYFDRVYGQPSGFYGALANADGELIDPSFDLYNQAFALLAFAHMAEALPERKAEMVERSDNLRRKLWSHCKHPLAGFEEDNPPRLPLGSNPHMHLFEACLASQEAEGFDRNAWTDLADEIANLAMDCFIDAESGALREFFDHDWRPFPGAKGRIIEPGHHFEWAWLLLRWAERRGNDRAILKARRLFEIGETHGLCPGREVVVMTLLDDFSIADPVARLWPQTEWLKAAIRFAALTDGAERQRYLTSARRATTALQRFLDVPVRGLWRDKQKADGSFVEEPAPASTFYHILCAIHELEDCLKRM